MHFVNYHDTGGKRWRWLYGDELELTRVVGLQPGNVSEGMRQAANRLSDGFGEMGAALRAPFASQSDAAGDSGAGGAAVRVIRATPAALAKPFSGGKSTPYPPVTE